MEVLIEIPEEIEKCIEYIPESKLPGIFAKMIVEGVKQRQGKTVRSDGAGQVGESVNIRTILQAIESLHIPGATNQQPLDTMQETKAFTGEDAVEQVAEPIGLLEADNMDLDSLGDLLSLLK